MSDIYQAYVLYIKKSQLSLMQFLIFSLWESLVADAFLNIKNDLGI